MAARALSGERARPLRGMPHAARRLEQMELSRPLEGFALGRIAAPAITPGASIAWLDSRGTARFPRQRSRDTRLGLQRHAPRNYAEHRHLTVEDLDAMVSYLHGDIPLPPVPAAADPAAESAVAKGPGRFTYVALCAGCHGLVATACPIRWWRCATTPRSGFLIRAT